MLVFLQRFFAENVIVVRKGTALCVKGKVGAVVLRDITEVCQEKHVQRAEIHFGNHTKIQIFGVPKKYHQRIKNVVASRA